MPETINSVGSEQQKPSAQITDAEAEERIQEEIRKVAREAALEKAQRNIRAVQKKELDDNK